MSWANDNPELYDQIVQQGIMNYLQKRSHVELDETQLGYILDMLHDECREGRVIYQELETCAFREIDDAERQYFAEMVDQAKDRG